MAKHAKGTISATNTTIGPVELSKGEVLSVFVDYGSGNIVLKYSPDNSTFVNVEDAYTADTVKLADLPGFYQLVGDTSPSADVHLVAR